MEAVNDSICTKNNYGMALSRCIVYSIGFTYLVTGKVTVISVGSTTGTWRLHVFQRSWKYLPCIRFHKSHPIINRRKGVKAGGNVV